MHEKNIALLCDEADRLLQLNINLLRQMVEEPDVLSVSVKPMPSVTPAPCRLN